jgi:ELWxxDGT repeat protein
MDLTYGDELWRYDPGTDTTQMVVDINPGPNLSRPQELAVFDGHLYFAADDGRRTGMSCGESVLWRIFKAAYGGWAELGAGSSYTDCRE